MTLDQRTCQIRSRSTFSISNEPYHESARTGNIRIEGENALGVAFAGHLLGNRSGRRSNNAEYGVGGNTPNNSF